MNNSKKAMAEGLKQLMRQRPFHKITVDNICKEARTSHRNFYRHFSDKYELLNWIYDEDFLKLLPDQGTMNIWAYLPEICRHLYEDRIFYLRAFDVTGQNSFREFCTEKLYPLLMDGFGKAFDRVETAQYVITNITDATFDAFQRWLSSPEPMPPDEYAQKMIQTVTDLAEMIYQMGQPYTHREEEH